MTGPRKRRRTAAEMAEVREGLVKIAEEHQPATVRQIFYLAVSAGLIDKTEVEYKSTVCRLLSDARLNGTLSWRTVVDHTRGRAALALMTGWKACSTWRGAPIGGQCGSTRPTGWRSGPRRTP